MRILGFSKKWEKLNQDEFTTFRFCRKDRDWEVGELAQVVYKPRRKGGGERLGLAQIISKEPRNLGPDWGQDGLPMITTDEAIEDGFANWGEMFDWLGKVYELHRLAMEPMNKLTIAWFERSQK